MRGKFNNMVEKVVNKVALSPNLVLKNISNIRSFLTKISRTDIGECRVRDGV